MVFRPASESDLPALLEMQRDFYAQHHIVFSRRASEQSMRTLIADASLGRMLIIEHEGEIAGYFALVFGFSMEFRGRSALLDELYVVAPLRNRGLGSSALRFAEQLCIDENVQVLQLEVDRENRGAQALYLRNGFFDRNNLLLSKRLASRTITT